MKLLLDECIYPAVANVLRSADLDVLRVSDLIPGSRDEVVLELAHRESRVLVTLDKDLGELAVRFGQAQDGIIRLRNIPASDQASVILEVVSRYDQELTAKAKITVSPMRIRVRLTEQPLRIPPEDA